MSHPAKLRILAGAVILIMFLLVGLIVEGILRYGWKEPYQWDRRLMFLSQGDNLRNTDWGGFTYQPNAKIRSQTYYITNLNGPELVKEYDYWFQSNSYGLVQSKEIATSKPAILLLGDSYTEGQGASPWFYTLEGSWARGSAYQLINGGLVGTGVESWGRLYRELTSRVIIAKTVIIFISDDWTRTVLQFSPQTLDCLISASQCEGEEFFYGLPEEPADAKAQIERLAQIRVDYLRRLKNRSALYKKLVPAYHTLRAYLRGYASPYSEQIEVSKRVAMEFVEELGRENVLFIHLPAKHEIDTGPDWAGKVADQFLLENRISMVDGFSTCGLTVRDYHRRDGHPNASGYEKIAKCVKNAMMDAFDH